MYRQISKGSWTFTDQDVGLQVSDCTAEALKVIDSLDNHTYAMLNFTFICMYVVAIYIIYHCLFQCCLLLSKLPPEVVGEKMEPEKLFDSVNIMLSLQVNLFYFF